MGLFDFLKRKKNNDEALNEEVEIKEYSETEEEVMEKGEQTKEITSQEISSQEISPQEISSLETLPHEILSHEMLSHETLPQEMVTEDNSKDFKEVLDEEASEKSTEDSSINTEETKKGFFRKIFSGLDKTRRSIIGGVENVLKSFVKIDDELFEELEEILIMADIGVETSTLIIDSVKNRVKKEKITEASAIKNLIKEEITKILVEDETELELKSPSVILIIGVNGVGKTTTIGKLTNNFKNQGKKVVLAAADTFRAAAIDQLEVWGTRSNVDVIKHQENSDPGAVVYDAIQASKARNADILICDTAGRLHNKKNLMEELKKIFKIINREHPNAQLEVFLVLDATTGQNALQQAKLFKEAANITGLVLTKLDGTAKGGIVISIKNELKLPVRFIGVGEGINDLQPFNAEDFAAALFGVEENESTSN